MSYVTQTIAVAIARGEQHLRDFRPSTISGSTLMSYTHSLCSLAIWNGWISPHLEDLSINAAFEFKIPN